MALKIVVFGATGMVGRQVIKHALSLGYSVKAFGRNVEDLIDKDLKDEDFVAIKGYVFEEEEVYNALSGADAVISTLGGAFDGKDQTRSLGLKNIIKQMEKAGVKRIVALGGSGILNADEDTLIIDTPGYPEIYLPVGKEHLKAYQHLGASTLEWTIVGAPNILEEEATGEYHTAANYPPSSNKGSITVGDLALFMVTEVSGKNYVHKKVGISN